MTTHDGDWELLRQEWQRPGRSRAAVTTAFEGLTKARRTLLFTRTTEIVIVFSSLVFVIMALRHAANPLVATLGVIVSVGNVVAWAQRIALRRREEKSDSAATADYLTSMRRLRVSQARLAELVWVVLTMELFFFIPWWVIGSRVHSRRITDMGSLLTMWLPIVVMLALYMWAFRLRARASREIQAIDRLETDEHTM